MTRSSRTRPIRPDRLHVLGTRQRDDAVSWLTAQLAWERALDRMRASERIESAPRAA